jgi:hypothetical protein
MAPGSDRFTPSALQSDIKPALTAAAIQRYCSIGLKLPLPPFL